MRALKKTLRAHRFNVVLVRHKLSDGYSDDAIAALRADHARNHAGILVLANAGTPASQEARQLALGADCVLRDPVRTDVLLEYLARYQGRAESRRPARRRERRASFRFAGARLLPLERCIEYDGCCTALTPREVQLAELLAESAGSVVTYTTLYSEILGRRFRGDTSNLRVLLGKLDASLRSIGIVLRKYVEVIPKTGYRYQPPRRPSLRLARRRDSSESAAA